MFLLMAFISSSEVKTINFICGVTTNEIMLHFSSHEFYKISIYQIEFGFSFYCINRFSLTVKAATLIFISGRGSAIHLLNKGNQVLYIIW